MDNTCLMLGLDGKSMPAPLSVRSYPSPCACICQHILSPIGPLGTRSILDGFAKHLLIVLLFVLEKLFDQALLVSLRANILRTPEANKHQTWRFIKGKRGHDVTSDVSVVSGARRISSYTFVSAIATRTGQADRVGDAARPIRYKQHAI